MRNEFIFPSCQYTNSQSFIDLGNFYYLFIHLSSYYSFLLLLLLLLICIIIVNRRSPRVSSTVDNYLVKMKKQRLLMIQEMRQKKYKIIILGIKSSRRPGSVEYSSTKSGLVHRLVDLGSG